MPPKDTTKGNMELWNQVCETDPAITTKVDLRGGFTAICAQAQRKRATELWGPYGINWGLSECHFCNIHNSEGKVVEIGLDARFVFPTGGTFPISSDIEYKPGNDTRKKLMTDCITKALSMLGFNSDVFEGKFDDNKYVEELKRKRNQVPVNPKAEMARILTGLKGSAPTKDEYGAVFGLLGAAMNLDGRVDDAEVVKTLAKLKERMAKDKVVWSDLQLKPEDAPGTLDF